MVKHPATDGGGERPPCLGLRVNVGRATSEVDQDSFFLLDAAAERFRQRLPQPIELGRQSEQESLGSRVRGRRPLRPVGDRRGHRLILHRVGCCMPVIGPRWGEWFIQRPRFSGSPRIFTLLHVSRMVGSSSLLHDRSQESVSALGEPGMPAVYRSGSEDRFGDARQSPWRVNPAQL